MKVWSFLKNNVYIKNILLAIIISVVLVFLVLWWLNSYTQHGQAVIVPDVKGLPVEQAVSFFEKNGLRCEVSDSVYTKKVQPGHIVETIPPAGTKVKENRIIFITVNAFSRKTFAIPDLKDQSLRQAQSMLTAIGFRDMTVEYVEGAYRDLVVGVKFQNRELQSGERVPSDAILTILVSSGNAYEESNDSTEVVNEGEVQQQEDSWF